MLFFPKSHSSFIMFLHYDEWDYFRCEGLAKFRAMKKQHIQFFNCNTIKNRISLTLIIIFLVYTYHVEYLHQPGVVRKIETHSDNGIPSGNFGLIYRNKMHSDKSKLLYSKLLNPEKKVPKGVQKLLNLFFGMVWRCEMFLFPWLQMDILP